MGGGFLFLDTRLLQNLTKKQSLISNINMQQGLQKCVKFVFGSLCFLIYFRKSLKQDNVFADIAHSIAKIWPHTKISIF